MTAIEHPANHRQTRWTRSTVYLDMWVDADDDAEELARRSVPPSTMSLPGWCDT